MTDPKPPRGGARKGAGRKLKGAEPRLRYCVTLTETERRTAELLGEGVVSRGIARALLTCPISKPHASNLKGSS